MSLLCFAQMAEMYCKELFVHDNDMEIFHLLYGLYISDEDAVGSEQSGENEDEKELVTYFISTSVQFTSSKMNRYLILFKRL